MLLESAKETGHYPSATAPQSQRQQMDVRFCLEAGTIGREAKLRDDSSRSDQERALPSAPRQLVPSPWQMTYMDGDYAVVDERVRERGSETRFAGLIGTRVTLASGVLRSARSPVPSCEGPGAPSSVARMP